MAESVYQNIVRFVKNWSEGVDFTLPMQQEVDKTQVKSFY